MIHHSAVCRACPLVAVRDRHAVDEYRNGAGFVETVRTYHISEPRFRRLLTDAGVPIRRRGVFDETSVPSKRWVLEHCRTLSGSRAQRIRRDVAAMIARHGLPVLLAARTVEDVPDVPWGSGWVRALDVVQAYHRETGQAEATWSGEAATGSEAL